MILIAVHWVGQHLFHLADYIVIHFGGELNAERLIASDISNASSSKIAKSLFKDIEKLIVEKYSRERAYFVSDNAKKAHSNGVRLSPKKKSPEKFDLMLN